MNLLITITNFLPDILVLYLIIYGWKLEGKSVRRRIRRHLQSVDAVSSSSDEEEVLYRLFKCAKGSSSDFTALAVSCISLMLSLARLNHAWVLVLASTLVVILVWYTHFVWANADLDTIDKCCLAQRLVAGVLVLASAAVKA